MIPSTTAPSSYSSSPLPIPVSDVKIEVDVIEEMNDKSTLQPPPTLLPFPKLKLEEEEEEEEEEEDAQITEGYASSSEGAPIRIEDLKMEIALEYDSDESAHSAPPPPLSTSFNPMPASVKMEDDSIDETSSDSPSPSTSQKDSQKDLYKLRKVRNMANPLAKNLFPADLVPTLKGKHSVLMYRIPPVNEYCYTFQHHRTNKNNTSVYDCVQCKMLKKNTQAKVVNNQFITDPAALPHSCKPVAFSAQEEFRKINEKHRSYIPRRVIREQKRAEKQRKRELKEHDSAEPQAPPPGRLSKRQKVIQEQKSVKEE